MTALNRLFVRRLTSIGAVEDGDDPEAKIMLFKRRFTQEQRDVLAEKGQALPDGSFPIESATDLKNAVTSFVRAKNRTAAKKHIIRQAKRLKRTDMLPEGWIGKDADSDHGKETGMETEEREAFEKTIAELEARVEELDGSDDDVMKGTSDEVREQFAKQTAELEKQAAELAKERDARLTAEFVKTAETYTSILGDAAEAGPKLKTLAETDAYDWLVEKLNTVSAIVATSDLFKELGVSDEADPTVAIEALAKEKQKDNSELTIEQAKVLVRTERPDLKDAERAGV